MENLRLKTFQNLVQIFDKNMLPYLLSFLYRGQSNGNK